MECVLKPAERSLAGGSPEETADPGATHKSLTLLGPAHLLDIPTYHSSCVISFQQPELTANQLSLVRGQTPSPHPTSPHLGALHCDTSWGDDGYPWAFGKDVNTFSHMYTLTRMLHSHTHIRTHRRFSDKQGWLSPELLSLSQTCVPSLLWAANMLT